MVVSILLYGNCTRMLQAILNKSWKQHPTKWQLYGHQPPISKTIQIRGLRYVGQYYRSMDELISEVLQWSPLHRRASVGLPTRTYLQLLYMDKGCSLEDLPEVMDERDEWRERVREICTNSTTWYYSFFNRGIS